MSNTLLRACLTVKLLPNPKNIQIHDQNIFRALVYFHTQKDLVSCTGISEYVNICKTAHIVCMSVGNYINEI